MPSVRRYLAALPIAVIAILTMAVAAAFGVILIRAELVLQTGADPLELRLVMAELTAIGALLAGIVPLTLVLAAIAWHRARCDADRWHAMQRVLADKRLASRQDPLTGWLNGVTFEYELQARLGQLDRDGAEAVLLVLWLNRLAERTAPRGRWLFESLTRLIAERLQARLSPADLKGSCDGREFRLLVTADGNFDELLRCLDDPLLLEGEAHPIAVEFGIAGFPADARAARTLLDEAWRDLLDRRAAALIPQNPGTDHAMGEPLTLPPIRSRSARATDRLAPTPPA